MDMYKSFMDFYEEPQAMGFLKSQPGLLQIHGADFVLQSPDWVGTRISERPSPHVHTSPGI